MQTVIIVHGGAGAWDLSSDRLEIGRAACRAAAQVGQAILTAGGSALDAVETAVNTLEDSPVLDAGRGSYLNALGEIEMDALIMDGRTLELGAVAAVQHVQYPISLARRVMVDSEHNMLVGRGAELFADEIGFPRCEFADLLVREELQTYQQLRDNLAYQTDTIFHEPGSMGDTVGAVAMDANGSLATATSTGGTRKKHPGRVGDSPLIGSGGYADNLTAAVSATGNGEKLMQVLISKQVCDFVAKGMSAKAACEAAIDLLAERVQGEGGLIAVDAQGQIGFAFNTTAMPYAYALNADEIVDGR
ncbi:MAG: isoaspartyl peptidase/L-asparaginase [Anaerolineales bacterium]|nr:isoaspartyl peptidase/L-asparaginase [Anaerolineales bacterium]